MDRVLLSGPAGCGKTERVVGEIRRLLGRGPVERFVVLVPTYSRAEHLKRRILRGGPTGIFDRGIHTFEQLAERRTGRRLSDLAPAAVRDALLVEALAATSAPEFGSAARFPGFRRAALRLLKELKGTDLAEGLDEALERATSAGESLPSGRGRKLAALAPVLRCYEKRLTDAGLLDHEDLLRELLTRLRADPGEPLRLFALDGFTDLTEVQTCIVQILAGGAERAIVTLLADGERADGPFAAGSSLRANLLAGSHLVEERLAGNHRANGDLARLERAVAGDAVSPRAPDGSVRFLAGGDRDDEADRVARTCLRFVTDDGIPRSDVLVVVRSLESATAARVLDALRRHRVPARRIGAAPLLGSPAVRNAVRVLRLLGGIEDDEEALAALRSGAARGVDPREADRLDRAATASGARGLDGIERLAVARELITCRTWMDNVRRLRPGPSPRPPSVLAGEFLAGVEELAVFSFEGASAADEQRIAADAASVRTFAGVVVETAQGVTAAGHAAVSPAELVRRIEEAVGSASCAAPDRRADVVNVVDANEARQWEARAVVVAGLRLGEWPAGSREDLFVGDRDRASIARSGVRLPSRLDEALRRERLLFYTAVTRARERLVLTTSSTDEKGDPELRSQFLDDAMRLFEPLPLEGAERSAGDVRPAAGESFGDDDLRRTALAALTERFESGTSSERRAHTGAALLARLVARESTGRRRPPQGSVLVEAARWFRGAGRPLSPRGAARLALASPRRRSASQLANFAQCAYRYFADKGLGLSEEDAAADDGPDAALLGKIAHAALEVSLRERLRGEDAARAFDVVWTEHAHRFTTSLRLARERAALRRIVLERIDEEAERPLVPGFAPREFERAFGMEGAPALVVAAVPGPRGEAVELAGKIDRIDVDERGRAIVLDYKYSDVARFGNLEQKLAEGVDLQLPLYALAAERVLGREVVAAGYVTLKDGKERWLRLAPDAPGRSRADVAWVGPERAARFEAVEARIRELDGKIREGGIVPEPRDPERCGRGRCAYADLCRYEGSRP